MPPLLSIALCLLVALRLHPIVANDEVVATIADKKYNETEIHARFHWKDIFVLGSHYEGVAVHETDQDDHWSVKAPLAFAVPNQGSLNGLMNERDLDGKVAVFKRSHDENVQSAQPYWARQANAKAAIIVDFPHSSEKNFALWAAIYADRLGRRTYKVLLHKHPIPTVIISHHTFERIAAGLDLATGDLWTSEGVWGNQHQFKSSPYASWFEPFPSDDHHDEL